MAESEEGSKGAADKNGNPTPPNNTDQKSEAGKRTGDGLPRQGTEESKPEVAEPEHGNNVRPERVPDKFIESGETKSETVSAPASAQPVPRMKTRLLGGHWLLPVLLLFIAVVSMNSVSNRDEAIAKLQAEIAELKDQFFHIRNDSSVVFNEQGERILPSSGGLDEAKKRLHAEVEIRRNQIINIQSIALTGNSNIVLIKNNRTMKVSGENSLSFNDFYNYLKKFYYSNYFDSNFLVALSVLCCGALGSITHAVRYRGNYTRSDVLLGMLAGFVVFLAMKGGKNILITDTSPGGLSLNPYGISFIALLSGMFTELGHRLLATIAETLSQRVTDAMAPQIPSGQQGRSQAVSTADSTSHSKNGTDGSPPH